MVQEPAFYDALVAEVLGRANIRPLLTPPSGVEVSVRSGTGTRILFVINHTDETRHVDLPAAALDLLSGQAAERSVDLEPFGVAVLKLA